MLHCWAWGLWMDRFEASERDDVLLYESPIGLGALADLPPAASLATTDPAPPLVLYVISLYGVHNWQGERIDGDALIVRPSDQPERSLLAAVLGCVEAELSALLGRGGSWAVRKITSIDGYRLRFEPN